MPRKDLALRDYAMTDGDLIQYADYIQAFVARNATEFATRNISDADAFEAAARSAFVALPADSVYQCIVTTKAEEKVAAEQAMSDAIASLCSRAEAAHGGTRGACSSYGFEGLASLGDSEKHRQALAIAYMTNKNMSALGNEGHNTTLQTALTNKISAFDTAINAVNIAEATRDLKTKQRVDAGNLLFKEVSRLTKAGQALLRIPTNRDTTTMC